MTKTLQGYSNYIIYDDGRIFNMKWQRFLKPTTIHEGKYKFIRLVSDQGKGKYFYVHFLIKKLFGNVCPEIEGLEHKPIKGYEGLYECYSDGSIFSCRREMFLKTVINNGNNYIYLSNDSGKKFYKVASLVLATFSNSYNRKDQIIFKDNDKTNCSLNNLTVIRK